MRYLVASARPASSIWIWRGHRDGPLPPYILAYCPPGKQLFRPPIVDSKPDALLFIACFIVLTGGKVQSGGYMLSTARYQRNPGNYGAIE